MAIHYVDMDDPRPGGDHLLDLGAEPGEISGENRGRDPQLMEEPLLRSGRDVRGALRRAQTALSMLPWQWLQATTAVLDMRTIVECSPQFGHTEVSS